MTFEEILPEMRKGKRARRRHWQEARSHNYDYISLVDYSDDDDDDFRASTKIHITFKDDRDMADKESFYHNLYINDLVAHDWEIIKDTSTNPLEEYSYYTSSLSHNHLTGILSELYVNNGYVEKVDYNNHIMFIVTIKDYPFKYRDKLHFVLNNDSIYDDWSIVTKIISYPDNYEMIKNKKQNKSHEILEIVDKIAKKSRNRKEDNMKIINQYRGTGKTTALVHTSNVTGYPIVVKNGIHKNYVKELAKMLNVTIPEPLIYNEVKDVDNVLIDDIELILKDILNDYLDTNVVAVTMSVPEFKDEDNNV